MQGFSSSSSCASWSLLQLLAWQLDTWKASPGMAGNGAHARQERTFGVTLNSTVKGTLKGGRVVPKASGESHLNRRHIWEKWVSRRGQSKRPLLPILRALLLNASLCPVVGWRVGALVIQGNVRSKRILKALLLFFQLH